ncbi:MAG: nuclear transport factor 2 family protein [Acidimicrobiales bacterium]
MPDSAREIEHLLYRYAECIDGGDLDGLAALFLHGRIAPIPDAINEGPDAVRAMYDGVKIYPDGTPKTKHVTTNVIVEVDEDAGAARARSYYTVLQATDALPLQVVITGRYHDTFHRVGGEWWFDTRTMFVDQVGDLSHHLTFEIPRS